MPTDGKKAGANSETLKTSQTSVAAPATEQKNCEKLAPPAKTLNSIQDVVFNTFEAGEQKDEKKTVSKGKFLTD